MFRFTRRSLALDGDFQVVVELTGLRVLLGPKPATEWSNEEELRRVQLARRDPLRISQRKGWTYHMSYLYQSCNLLFWLRTHAFLSVLFWRTAHSRQRLVDRADLLGPDDRKEGRAVVGCDCCEC